MICCVRSAINAALSVGRASASSYESVCKRLRSAEDTGERLDRDTCDVVQRLLDGQRNAGGLRVKTQLHRARVLRTEAFLHRACPHDASGAILRDLFEEIVVSVEEEREPRDKLIDIHPAIDAVLNILDAVAQRERQLLQTRSHRPRGCDNQRSRSDCISERASSCIRTYRSRASSPA